MKRRRKHSLEEKLAILEDAKVLGVAGACRKYEIATSMFYRWRAKFEAHGASGLEQKAGGSEAERELRALEAENLRLKRLVADKELELQILRDLKKKETSNRNGRSS